MYAYDCYISDCKINLNEDLEKIFEIFLFSKFLVIIIIDKKIGNIGNSIVT